MGDNVERNFSVRMGMDDQEGGVAWSTEGARGTACWLLRCFIEFREFVVLVTGNIFAKLSSSTLSSASPQGSGG